MAGPGAIEKPTVFISHAVTDEPIANVVRGEIRRIFADGVTVFASSVPGVIEPGAEWLDAIQENLSSATAVLVIVSPTSINRPWVWFEVGASWSKMEEGQGSIIPVCVPEIDKGSLPEPLGRLQAMSLGVASETKEVFQTLIRQFGFGQIKGFRHASIKAKLPKYDSLPLADIDLRSGTIYTGPYEGYSDEELALVVDDQMIRPDFREFRDHRGSSTTNLFRGQLLHFRALDEDYFLPPGTSKKLLPDLVVRNYPTDIQLETENTVRFSMYGWEDYQIWLQENGYA